MKNNMKWRITGRFLVTVICVVITVVIINIVSLSGLVIYRNVTNIGMPKYDIEGIVRDFSSNIKEIDNKIYIDDRGKVILDSKNGWIQIIDANNNEVYNYKKPSYIKNKHTAAEIVNLYKYKTSDKRNEVSTNFVAEKNIGNKRLTYIIGLQNNDITKYVITTRNSEVIQIIKSATIIIIIVDGIIALIFGYLFIRKLTNPLGEILLGIKKLENEEYDLYYEAKGMYNDLYYSLNNLSDRLQENKRNRKKLDNMREEWISNISHDIKTPLASIQGYAEIIKDEDYDFTKEEIGEYAEIIENKSKYIKELVEDLNLSTRLKNNTLTLNKEKINLANLIKDIIIDILNDTRYENREIDFHCENDNIEINGDRILIRRAIINILFNAIVHNSEDVKIDVTLKKQDKISIIIEDNGRGIKGEELNRIFDRYYRGTNTGERHKGSGLGMAISKETIVAHGGDITIESELGKGTKVNILI
ncbi:HAMP domain-containing histidine kinase [Clostridium botulinum]|uniref:sensor histidine kinase n=1 Tax=Clostridium botulinum TaxID=1491 RepID=UPI0007DF3194|nr:HAMP domain-containing sensor histidine kinase [Clostridium botulinum]KEI86385.1 histidine kinase [Clostridium botulinum B2 267]MBY6996041.1 HAMP domain-containing histidine kinase [Clostridium botulinum]MBY7011610.1 HAMP domain-containing histidine kinase [Clostridium botulinum]MCR1156505.1 HAMP domain-containing histidine kinase [Clostridium botulinum]MCS6166175.1 sensor histidine kinase [Clostridium botulinum]